MQAPWRAVHALSQPQPIEGQDLSPHETLVSRLASRRLPFAGCRLGHSRRELGTSHCPHAPRTIGAPLLLMLNSCHTHMQHTSFHLALFLWLVTPNFLDPASEAAVCTRQQVCVRACMRKLEHAGRRAHRDARGRIKSAFSRQLPTCVLCSCCLLFVQHNLALSVGAFDILHANSCARDRKDAMHCNLLQSCPSLHRLNACQPVQLQRHCQPCAFATRQPSRLLQPAEPRCASAQLCVHNTGD